MAEVYNCKTRVNRIDRVKGRLRRKIKCYEREQVLIKREVDKLMKKVLEVEHLTLKTIRMRAKYGKNWGMDDDAEIKAKIEAIRKEVIPLKKIYKEAHEVIISGLHI